MGQTNSKKTKKPKFKVKYPKPEIKNQIYALELKLMNYTDLIFKEQYYIDDIYIEYFGTNYIHTIYSLHNDNIPRDKIVLIHGYGGTASYFYGMMKYLYKDFDFYALDLLGMGLSSRPQINLKTASEYINFFIDSIELWRKTMNIEKFYLVGHSLGGFISGYYSLKYPQHIQRLALLSPAGITNTNLGDNVSNNMNNNMKAHAKVLHCIWDCKLTVKDFYRVLCFRQLARKALKNDYDIPVEEKELVNKIIYETVKYPKDLTDVIYYLFRPPLPTAVKPLEYSFLFNVSDYKIDFYFGENDWMDMKGSKRLVEKNSSRFSLSIINDTGHHFPVEKPKEMCNKLIENFYKDYK
jgi:cardiolipin-specific phospholipase